MPACDSFMWFPDRGGAKFEGETTDAYFATKKAFEISSFAFDVSNGNEEERGGKFEAFRITKLVDSTSMPLYKACSMGTLIPTICLAIRKAGGNHLIYLQFIFRYAKVVGITWNGSLDQYASEDMKFTFKAMGAQYVQQKPDGTFGKRQSWSWTAATEEGKKGEPTMDVGLSEPVPDFLPPHP
jgi:type VI protein secretion system component Hcp